MFFFIGIFLCLIFKFFIIFKMSYCLCLNCFIIFKYVNYYSAMLLEGFIMVELNF